MADNPTLVDPAGFRRKFFLLNLPAVWGYVLFFTRNEPKLWALLLPLSGLILLGQYHVIRRTRRWPLQLLILFGAMTLFLFLSGITLSWNDSVGGKLPGSWWGRLDAGIRIAVFGQIFALPVFIPLAILNLLLLRDVRKPRSQA